MKRIIAALLFCGLAAAPAAAFDKRMAAQLEKLDPQTRLEQRCDTEALEEIAGDSNGFRPDKVIAYTFAEPVYGKTTISAPGAVFRSQGDWYKLSFHCTTGPRGLNVRAFDYAIGKKVPRSKWEEFYLYD